MAASNRKYVVNITGSPISELGLMVQFFREKEKRYGRACTDGRVYAYACYTRIYIEQVCIMEIHGLYDFSKISRTFPYLGLRLSGKRLSPWRKEDR